MGEFEPPEGPEEPESLEVTVPAEWEPGVYANTSMVSFTPREFTVDFIRIRPRETSGVLVARISCSSRAAMELCWNHSCASGLNGYSPTEAREMATHSKPEEGEPERLRPRS